MAEEKENTRSLGAWLKAGVTSVFGLVSGAALMYLTPVVDSVIKPGKPLANFATQVQGLTVTFSNRTLHATEGWWDFGDGSALEPFSPKQDTVTHTFPHADKFNVKLSVQNLIGEQNERVAAVNVGTENSPRLDIKRFEVTPDPQLAGVYHVKAEVENAQLCIWSLGEHRPLVVSSDTSANQDRQITITHPGKHVLRLVAFNGKETVEKDCVVEVGSDVSKVLTCACARLQVCYDAVQVQRETLQRNISVPWPAGHRETTCSFAIARTLDNAHKDYKVLDVAVANKGDAHVRNVQVELAADRGSFVLRGELVQQAHWWQLNQHAPPPWVAQVTLTLERRSAPQQVAMDEVPVKMNVPGTTTIPIPRLSQGWQMTQKHLHLELSDGKERVWTGEQPPANAALKLGARTFVVSGVEQDGQLVLQISNTVPARPASR